MYIFSIIALAEPLITDDAEAQRKFTFSQSMSQTPEVVNLASLLEEAVLQLRKEVPLQLVVTMFQKMVHLALFCSR